MKKTKTIDLKGNEYAQVKDRVLEFRNENPHGLIETEPQFTEDTVVFKARIVKDKSDETSAEATGHAYGDAKGTKSFEKLETIAVGRALALLGYTAGGEIASSEEMEEFEAYKKEQHEIRINECTEQLQAAKNLDELKTIWDTLDGACKVELNTLKADLKEKLDEKATNGTKKRGVGKMEKGKDNGDTRPDSEKGDS